IREEWGNPAPDFFGPVGNTYIFDIANNTFKPSFGLVLGFGQTINETCSSDYRPGVQSTWDNSQMQQFLLSYGYVRNSAPVFTP
ncbi:MAG: hypothetical protein ACRCVX_04820, partial [Shewanella sp.]